MRPSSDRNDFFHTQGLSVAWLINDWGSARAFATWEARVSNDPDVSEYQKTDAGLGLSVALRFSPRGFRLPAPRLRVNALESLVRSPVSAPNAVALWDATSVWKAFRRQRIRRVCSPGRAPPPEARAR